jgi:hypothetical protein
MNLRRIEQHAGSGAACSRAPTQSGDPLITVALPTHNRSEQLFRAAFESILSQTYQNIEIIVADNSSTTVDVAQIVASYGDPRVRYHRHPVNIGMAANWSWCVAEAAGDWISVFHDDDLMVPDHIRNVAKMARRYPEATLQFSAMQLIDGHGSPKEDPYWNHTMPRDSPQPGQLLVDYIAANFRNVICAPCVAVQGKVYKTALPFSSAPQFSTDLNMWLRILTTPGASFVAHRELGVYYRLHDGQMTKDFIHQVNRCFLIELFRVFLKLSLPAMASFLRRVIGIARRSLVFRLGWSKRG